MINLNIVRAVNVISIILIASGSLCVSIGMIANGYMNLTPIGIGTVMGGVFIFIMGMFFVATEELLGKSKAAS